jgi:hypothetical protein
VEPTFETPTAESTTEPPQVLVPLPLICTKLLALLSGQFGGIGFCAFVLLATNRIVKIDITNILYIFFMLQKSKSR